MANYNKNWLYNEYVELFVNTTGSDPTKEEKDFLKKYFDTYDESGAKPIYYMAIFRLKRGWNKFIVYFFIAKSLKKDFKNSKQTALATIYKVFAKKMLLDAIKAYCKISD